MVTLPRIWQDLWPEHPVRWALGFALLYALLWQLMPLLPDALTVREERIHLVYLPAFVRALSVVVAGLSGVLGVFVGTVLVSVVNQGDPIQLALSQALASAAAPLLAYLVLWTALGRRPEPSLSVLLVVGTLSAVFNAANHALTWSFATSPLSLTMPAITLMILGDVLGVLLGGLIFRLLAGPLARLLNNL